MPEPLTYCPSVLYSMLEDPSSEIDATTEAPRTGGSGGSGGHGSTALHAHGGSGASEAEPSLASCLAPALISVASCGAVIGTQGVAALLAGASCLASLVKLDECLARQRAAAK